MELDEGIKTLGYIDLPIDSKIDLVDEIKKFKKDKNAVILGHFLYQP